MTDLVMLFPARFVMNELLTSKSVAKVGMHRYKTINRCKITRISGISSKAHRTNAILNIPKCNQNIARQRRDMSFNLSTPMCE